MPPPPGDRLAVERELRRKATREGSFLFCTIIRPFSALVAGGIYNYLADRGRLLPISKWLSSPLQHHWSVGVSSLTVVWLVYISVSASLLWLIEQYFEANQRYRIMRGWERLPEENRVE